MNANDGGLLGALLRGAALIEAEHPNYPQPDARLLRELHDRLRAMSLAAVDDPGGAHEMYLEFEEWLTENL